MSTTPALASFHPLIATQALLETIHAAGLPYWATIVVVTVALRTFLTLPIAVVQRTRQQRLRNLRPVILSWEQTFRRQVDMESMAAGARGSAQPEKRVGQLLLAPNWMSQMRDKVEELYRTYDCHPRRTFLLPWVQLPFFLTMSLTLRYMSAFPLPFLETPDRCNPGFIYGGFSVWTDIHLPDPTWMFPLLIGATHLINVEVRTCVMFAGNMVTRRQRMIINAFRVFAVASVPIATQIPVALCMFWLTSSSYSLLQSLAFRYLYPKR
ncbi:membrane insertase OXA1/ALB3/YidC [Hyaloraphidium curvatum]|nr:membrane insertase OXA1/ALB3/YidC [Hyaloraphidium curvatum]